MLGDFPMVAMPTAASEINLIETFADTKVIGITINHEHMTDAEVSAAIDELELELGLPATDPLTRPLDRLVDMVLPRSRLSPPALLPDDERAAARDRPRGRSRTTPARSSRGWRHWASASPASRRPRWARPAWAPRCSAAASPGWATRGSRTWPGSGPAASPRRRTLIRSPMLSQVDAVVRDADVSLNTEAAVLDGLGGRGAEPGHGPTAWS